MFASLDTARITLNSLALEFDADALTPEAAVRMVDQLGAIRAVVDGMLGNAAKWVAETTGGSAEIPESVARRLDAGRVRLVAIEAEIEVDTFVSDPRGSAVRPGVRRATLARVEVKIAPDADAANRDRNFAIRKLKTTE